MTRKYRIDYEALHENYLQQVRAEKLCWNEGDDLPPWQARNEREWWMMEDWANHELNQLPDGSETWKPSPPKIAKQHLDWLFNLGPEIQAAEHGDIEPLRKKLPHLAKFLHRPKRPRQGDRFPKRTDVFDKAKAAAIQARQIMALWRKRYGKQNRRPTDGPSAAEIAAKRWRVDVEDVLKWLKKIPAK